MKNLNEQIERINNLSNYMVGVVISEQEENTSNYKTGESYKYQFIDAMGKDIKTPIKLQGTAFDDGRGNASDGKYELSPSGTLTAEKVYGNYSGGPNMMAIFKNGKSLDLQSMEEKPNSGIYSHPDFTAAKVLVKVLPN